jgi:predicted NUDIX family NTP pyrophosphohydrolase
LLYRLNEGVRVLLAHPGGPLWVRRDDGAWSIPKGEYAADEDPLAAARREFAEELGSPPPDGPYLELGEIRQRNGKLVTAWAVAGDLDVATVVSNTFELEWPPRSGRRQVFPEIDRAAWFDLDEAATKLLAGQARFLERLRGHLSGP